MKRCFASLFFLSSVTAISAQLPVFQWAKAFEARNQNNYTITSNGRSVAVDQAGNVYSAGLFSYTTDFDPGPGVFTLSAATWADLSIYISKLSPDGDFLWAIQIPTWPEFGNIEIRVDNNNNVYIVSELRLPADFDPGPGVYILSPTGGWDAFVAKYDSNGNLIWAKQFGGPGDTVPRPDVLEIDKDNNVIVCGNFNNTVDFDPGPAVYNLTSSAHIQAFIVKLNSSGNFIWAKQFGNSPVVYSGSHIADIKCDALGAIYVTGDFTGDCDFDPGSGNYQMQSQGMQDGYVAKMDPGGNFIWARAFGNTTHDYYQYTETRGIDVGLNNNVYVTGDFFGTIDFDPGPNAHIISSPNNYDWYILKLNGQGDFVWADAVGGNEHDRGADVAASADGNVYAIGVIGHTADMDPGPGVYTITTVNQYGASALVKLNAGGGFMAAGPFDQVGPDYGSCLTRRMVVNDLQQIFITGYMGGIVDFDPGPGIYLLNSGNQSPYVLKLARCTNITTATLNISTCNSYVMNNEIFDSSGTYIRIIPNSTGCDSVITLNLTINRKHTEQSKTICQGESIFAGGGYQTTPGVYVDTLRTIQGCDSVVTTTLTVNPKPVPNLGPDRKLCLNAPVSITPGLFNTYLWQDNSSLPSIMVSSAGIYWVKVADNNNCTATDSLIILAIDTIPNKFLPADTAICNYGQSQLRAIRVYNSYQWNTGSTNASVSITQPGWYWLQVKDNNNCTGRDSIYVTVKECLKGVFVPTGFTPNHDGRNDELHPLVFGNILKYEFIVYDRAGQLMFRSVIPGEGWNGMYKGLPPNSGVFVWVCRYQLSGETEKLQKGTVVLIR